MSSSLDQYLAEATAILSDFLEPKFAAKLRSVLGLPEEQGLVEESCDSENVEPAKKKLKSGNADGPVEDYSVEFRMDLSKKDDVKQTVVQKKLAAAAKGTKSITSFFGKPKAK
jgi:hypothetical protein